MKLRTSFFNGTVLKKDITRFAPLWGLYTLFLLVVFLTGSRNDQQVLLASNLADMMRDMSVVSLIYGGLCANVLFGDLFQSRLCNALHAMPLRRESWFCTHVLSGVLFSLVPNLAATVFQMILLGKYFYVAPLWLAAATGHFLFFFGVGVFAVMCAGNRLGMAAVYAVINAFSAMVYALMKGVYEPLLYGIELESDPFTFFCPVFHMAEERFIRFDYDFINGVFSNGRITAYYPEMWGYLAVVALIGIVLAGFGLLLYRRRQLERAGDFLAIRGLEPVFVVICSVAGGVFLYALSETFGLTVNYVLMAIGVVVGFFASQMLIQRTVRVFRVRQFIGLAVLAVVITGSLLLTKMDLIGITRYVPETADVAFMRIYRDNERHSYAYPDVDSYQLEDPNEIDRFRQVHGQLLQERGEKTDGASRMYILYQLKDGRQVKRYYHIDERTAAYDELREYFSRWQYIFHGDSWQEVENSITSIDISFSKYLTESAYEDATTQAVDMEMAYITESITVTDPQEVARFLDAVYKDCQAGVMAQSHTFHVGEEPLGWCYLSSNLKDDNQVIIRNGDLFVDLKLYPEAKNTVAVVMDWFPEAE